MTLTAEWRTNADFDSVLIVEDERTVRAASVANAEVLHRLLTDPGDLDAWRGTVAVEGEKRLPSAWGDLVIARAHTGEVLTMDPEAFWSGIHQWFRSRGVDYDTPLAETQA
jgi:hypothetical protein